MLLLLDEPMAGMSQAESSQMTELLANLKGRYGIVLVEHDMDAVFKLADRITVLVYGRGIACGPPDAIRVNPEVQAARSEEHTSELQSLMRISYAGFCLKKKQKSTHHHYCP